MNAIWYAIVSFMLVTYVVLDGRNLGIGMLQWLVAKTPAEKRQVVTAIGPFWPWHEVWLVSFGGTLFAIFPRVLASAFSGYYLALFLILWCLILRGIALEIGGHFKDHLWQGFWNFVFVVSSFILALVFGAAGGNLARGVPIDNQGNFAMAFFTNFGVRGDVGLLDWFTVSIAIFTVVILGAHGATYLTFRTEGPVHYRCASLARWLWIGQLPLGLIVSLETWFVRPELVYHGITNPMTWLGVIIIVASGIGLIAGLRHKLEDLAFMASNFFIAGLLATGAATLFPVLLYSTLDPANNLTAYNAASSPDTLLAGLFWWPIALIVTVSCVVFISRRYTGRVSVSADDQVS